MTQSRLAPSLSSCNIRAAEHWHQQYAAWQTRRGAETRPVLLPVRQHTPRSQDERYGYCDSQEARARARASEDEQLRVFGGESGDEASLCAPMLKVVMDLDLW